MVFKKPIRPVNTIFLHCTASNSELEGQALLDSVRSFHIKSNGWSDIGYHFLIDAKGNIMAGRPLEMVPSAQKGFNTGSIAICLHGLNSDDFTPVQLKQAYDLCKTINSFYGNTLKFRGHKEVSNKSCPVFDYISIFGIKNGNLGEFNLTSDVKKPNNYPVVRINSKGAAVLNLQNLLNAHGASLDTDGIFGRLTDEAVKEFQENHGLTIDGIVGEKTWEELLK